MRRRSTPSCSGEVEGLNRGAWTAQEDKLLTSYIMAHGDGKWSHVPVRAGLNRSGKSCRLRWLNYLRPDIKRGNITQDEEDLIIRLHKLLGNRWSLIAGRLPGRTDNEIKNYWNTTLAKKLRTGSGATTSSEPRASSSKSSGSDDICPRPQVIQTKAGKCENLVIQHPPNCPEETSTINSVASDRLGLDEAHHHPGPQFTNQFLQAAVDDEYVINHYELQDEQNGVDFFREFNFESSIAMAMNAQADEFTPIDELIGGTADGFRNIGIMDLDLITFMLD